jgi:hypothetical protein
VIWVCMKTYSVMSGMSLCGNVFCNEWSEFVTQITHYRMRFHTNSDHTLQNTCSHNLRSLITEYVVTQTQITHYRKRFHTNSYHSLQNTFSYKLRSIWVCMKTYFVMSDLSLYENVFCNEWSEFVWQRIL